MTIFQKPELLSKWVWGQEKKLIICVTVPSPPPPKSNLFITDYPFLLKSQYSLSWTFPQFSQDTMISLGSGAFRIYFPSCMSLPPSITSVHQSGISLDASLPTEELLWWTLWGGLCHSLSHILTCTSIHTFLFCFLHFFVSLKKEMLNFRRWGNSYFRILSSTANKELVCALWTCSSCVSCIEAGEPLHWATSEAPNKKLGNL